MARQATKQSAKAVTTAGRTRHSVTITTIVSPSSPLHQQECQQQAPSSLEAALKLLESGAKPLTGFQRKVLQALCRVPAGHVTTYKHLAQSIHCCSNQAVGQALRRNPYAPTVPCHRVVATTAFTASCDYSGEEQEGKSKHFSTNLASSSSNKKMLPIGGFGGCLSGEKIDKKIQLLQKEGVKFIDANRGTIDPSCMYTFHEEEN
jgi:methylated-DNA-[protein]-cysteine S-methyltransferase